jgi:hypothetical protein
MVDRLSRPDDRHLPSPWARRSSAVAPPSTQRRPALNAILPIQRLLPFHQPSVFLLLYLVLPICPFDRSSCACWPAKTRTRGTRRANADDAEEEAEWKGAREGGAAQGKLVRVELGFGTSKWSGNSDGELGRKRGRQPNFASSTKQPRSSPATAPAPTAAHLQGTFPSVQTVQSILPDHFPKRSPAYNQPSFRQPFNSLLFFLFLRLQPPSNLPSHVSLPSAFLQLPLLGIILRLPQRTTSSIFPPHQRSTPASLCRSTVHPSETYSTPLQPYPQNSSSFSPGRSSSRRIQLSPLEPSVGLEESAERACFRLIGERQSAGVGFGGRTAGKWVVWPKETVGGRR